MHDHISSKPIAQECPRCSLEIGVAATSLLAPLADMLGMLGMLAMPLLFAQAVDARSAQPLLSVQVRSRHPCMLELSNLQKMHVASSNQNAGNRGIQHDHKIGAALH